MSKFYDYTKLKTECEQWNIPYSEYLTEITDYINALVLLPDTSIFSGHY